MYHDCAYCGKQVHDYDRDGHRTTRVSMKFHSDACRDLYWADVRRIRRAYERAENAINLLVDLALKDNAVAQVADTHLNMIAADIQRATDDN